MDNFNHTESQPFFNTISLTNIQWNIENEKAQGLQKIVEQVFKDNPTTKITPYLMLDYLDKMLNKNNNLLSVRRCISNLKNDDVIEKTALMRIGRENMPEHYYVLKGGNQSESILPGKSVSDFSKALTQPQLF